MSEHVPQPDVNWSPNGDQFFLGDGMSRIVIILAEQERKALVELARHEMRYPRDQVRLILRQELERRGLIEPEEKFEASQDCKCGKSA